MTSQLTLGLVGGMCSGKNTFGEYLAAEYHSQFTTSKIVSSSDAAREYISRNQLGEPTRDLTREISTQLREQFSRTYLVDWALAQTKGHDLQVVAGLYVPDEIQRVRALGGIVVAFQASDGVRRSRMVERSRAGEVSEEVFDRLDSEDMHGTVTDQRLRDALQMADYYVEDDGQSRHEALYAPIASLIVARVTGVKYETL